MTVFDQFYYSIFSFYKKRYRQKANSLALIYISILQITLIVLLACFFVVFFNKMHAEMMSITSAGVLFIIISIGVFFKNWMQYTGKKRITINAKMIKTKKTLVNVGVLWILPFIILVLACIILRAM